MGVKFNEKHQMQNQTGEVLGERDSKIPSLVETSPDLIFITDRNLKITFVNQTQRPYTKDQILGSNITDWVPAEYHDIVRESIERVLKSEKTVYYESTADGPHDSISWYSTRVGPIKHDDEVVGAMLVTTDITERKKIEEELRGSREEYLSVTNLTGDIIVKVDKEGRWTFLNDVGCEFWAKPREELLGVEFADYIHADDIERTTAVIQEMTETKKMVRGVVNRQKTPRGWRTVEWNAIPILEEAGNYAGFQATGRDVTEQKAAEERLRKTAENLERFNRLAVGRELRMIELKQEINDLLRSMGRQEKYRVPTLEDTKHRIGDGNGRER